MEKLNVDLSDFQTKKYCFLFSTLICTVQLHSVFRRLSENPMFSFVVYEQTDSVGGTWVYDERTGVDEYGIPIHTSMYKNLRWV